MKFPRAAGLAGGGHGGCGHGKVRCLLPASGVPSALMLPWNTEPVWCTGPDMADPSKGFRVHHAVARLRRAWWRLTFASVMISQCNAMALPRRKRAAQATCLTTQVLTSPCLLRRLGKPGWRGRPKSATGPMP